MSLQFTRTRTTPHETTLFLYILKAWIWGTKTINCVFTKKYRKLEYGTLKRSVVFFLQSQSQDWWYRMWQSRSSVREGGKWWTPFSSWVCLHSHSMCMSMHHILINTDDNNLKFTFLSNCFHLYRQTRVLVLPHHFNDTRRGTGNRAVSYLNIIYHPLLIFFTYMGASLSNGRGVIIQCYNTKYDSEVKWE